MFQFSKCLRHSRPIHLLACSILLLVVSVAPYLFLSEKDCQMRSRVRSPQRAQLCSLAARHSPRISSRIFRRTRFTRLIFRRAFPAPSPMVRSRSCRGVATLVTVVRAIAYLFLPTNETVRDTTRSHKRSRAPFSSEKRNEMNGRDQPRIFRARWRRVRSVH